jgi:Bacterial protein of unknown function (DUF922)
MNERNPGSLSFVKSSFRMSHNRCTSVALWVVACLLGATPSIHGQDVFVPRQLKAEAATQSQMDELPRGCVPYHRLTRADFKINNKAFPKVDKAHPSESAMITSCFTEGGYKYDCTQKDDHFVARITAWRVRSGFDRNRSARKSWFKFVEMLLTHEQGHLDINELHSKRLANMSLDKLPIGEGANADEAIKDLEIKVDALMDKVTKDIDTEQKAYDAKTVNGTNEPEQSKATAAIQVRLKLAGITYASQRTGD